MFILIYSFFPDNTNAIIPNIGINNFDTMHILEKAFICIVFQTIFIDWLLYDSSSGQSYMYNDISQVLSTVAINCRCLVYLDPNSTL